MIKEQLITSVVEDIAGHDVLPLIEVLKGKKNVSEFTLAEELKEEINTIRNKLYRLYDYNLVEFTRKKDKQKGWYIYYWTFIPSRIPKIMKDIKKKRLETLKGWLVAEQNNHFFECSNKCMRLKFEKAVDFEFKCPECGNLMNQEDNKEKIDHILKEIDELQKEIAAEPDYVEEVHEEEAEEPEIPKKTKLLKIIPKTDIKIALKEKKLEKKTLKKKIKKIIKKKK